MSTEITLTEDDMEITMQEGLNEIAINSSQFNAVFLNFQKTPLQFIKQRPGRGKSGSTCRACDGKKVINHIPCKTCNGAGVAVDYIEGWYIKTILNMATKFKWCSYIDRMWTEYGQTLVQGRVTIEIDGKEYTQSDIGDADIKYRKDTKEPVSIGDDYKAAVTDLIKRCANHWGIAGDVYSKRIETE